MLSEITTLSPIMGHANKQESFAHTQESRQQKHLLERPRSKTYEVLQDTYSVYLQRTQIISMKRDIMIVFHPGRNVSKKTEIAN